MRSSGPHSVPQHTHALTDLLKAAGAPAGDAAERSDEPHDFAVHVVFDLHVEAAQRPAAVPGAAVVLLFGLVDLLAQAVLDLVLVVGLKADERWTLRQSNDLMGRRCFLSGSDFGEPVLPSRSSTFWWIRIWST